MLSKPKVMKQRLPAIVVTDDMAIALSRIAQDEQLSLSEVVRQGLTFFLSEYAKKVSTEFNTDEYAEEVR